MAYHLIVNKNDYPNDSRFSRYGIFTIENTEEQGTNSLPLTQRDFTLQSQYNLITKINFFDILFLKFTILRVNLCYFFVKSLKVPTYLLIQRRNLHLLPVKYQQFQLQLQTSQLL